MPYDAEDRKAVLALWDGANPHKGAEKYRAKRGRPPKAVGEKKAQIALRVDADVLAWCRAQGDGGQTRMNAALKAYRDATI